MATVTLRLFAAARAAVGRDEIAVDVEGGTTVGALLAQLTPGAGAEMADLEAVLGRCSFLIDGVTTRDRAAVVPPGSVVDVMPPFAGG